MNLQTLIQEILNSNNIPHSFNEETLKLANSFTEPTKQDLKGLEDLRKKPLCTIDGATSRDFDDAVFCEPWHKGGFHLIVSIANVARYVTEGSAIDKEAYERGTSIYYPENCIPMLPEVLSNNLCSLKPGVDRLTLTLHMYIDRQGRCKKQHVTSAVINSHARLTYTQVQKFIEGQLTSEIPANVQKSLLHLERLYKIRRQQKTLRHSLDHTSEEQYFKFAGDQPIDVFYTKQTDANMLIEECMVLANNCIPKILIAKKELCIHRFHAAPKKKKRETLQDLVALYQLESMLTGNVTPKLIWDYVHAMPESIRSEFQAMILKCYEKAYYCPDNKGHFGLA